MLVDRDTELNSLYQEVKGPEKQAPMAARHPNHRLVFSGKDSEIITALRKQKNGDKFARLFDRGDWSGYEGRQSSADLALLRILRFRTGDDRGLLDRLFRQSALMRQKWDEPHSGDGRTYGEMTLDFALSGPCKTFGDDEDDVSDDDPLPTLNSIPPGTEGIAQVIEVMRQRITLLELELAVLNSVELRFACTNVALAKEIVRHVKAGKANEAGYVHMPMWRIARRLNISDSKLSRHALEGVEAGIFEKITRRSPHDVDPETGEIPDKPFEAATFFRPASTDLAELLTSLKDHRATTIDKPKHGGARLRCTLHPNADIIETTTWECAECGREVKEPRERILKQDAETAE